MKGKFPYTLRSNKSAVFLGMLSEVELAESTSTEYLAIS